MLAHRCRDADAARLGHAFQARRDIDAVAENVAVLDHDVAEIDADAELDAAILRHAGVAAGHAVLDFDRAGDGVDHAGELDQHAVAGQLDDAALVLGDPRVDQFLAARLERGKRGGLVDAHQPAVADHVGSQYGGKPSLGAFVSHRRRLLSLGTAWIEVLLTVRRQVHCAAAATPGRTARSVRSADSCAPGVGDWRQGLYMRPGTV